MSCADQGKLALDASRVTCQDAIELSVVDCGLNTDDNADVLTTTATLRYELR